MLTRVRVVAHQCGRSLRNGALYAWRERWTFITRPVVGVLRIRLRFKVRHLEPGVTVLIANWQTCRFLKTAVAQVLKRSPASTRIVIVDNASTDASRDFLRTLDPAIRVVRLPVNVGHGVALDLAAMCARTEFIVALDVDAFPISSTWIETLMEPLRKGKSVSGAGGSEGQIAPCCLMISLRRFMDERHTFTSRMIPGNDPWLRPSKFWDVGRGISVKEGSASLHRFERTDYLDEEHCIGEIFGNLIYHNGYATVDLKPASRGTATKADATATWKTAEERFAG